MVGSRSIYKYSYQSVQYMDLAHARRHRASGCVRRYCRVDTRYPAKLSLARLSLARVGSLLISSRSLVAKYEYCTSSDEVITSNYEYE